ncbi:MFS transporter [Candidatus Gottesmanbacteria bacterium]|nr:MFS transporter [Candidatus Gottesmanbacteria bacterium]
MKKIFGFPQNVFVLSLVSFLNDIGGETIKKTIPLFLTNVLGVKPAIVGLVEGLADATPQLLQPLSGTISDVFKKRKILVVIGQILRSAMLLLFWANSWIEVLLVRLSDRTGKGIAQSPRDALIAVSSEKGHVGRSFGLSRMFDNAGAFVGLVLAALIVLASSHGSLLLTKEMFQSIVLLAAIPLVLTVILISLFVRDIKGEDGNTQLSLHDKLGGKFYLFLGISFVFTLGNSSDAFIILKSQLAGLAVWQIFLLMAGYSLVSSVSGYYLSGLSDRVGRKKLLVAGWALYSAIYFLFGLTSGAAPIIGLTLFYGLYYGFTEGSAKAFVSDIVPATKKGTAYGLYNMTIGVTVFFASLIAGFLWQTIAPSATFYFGSAMAIIATIGLLII